MSVVLKTFRKRILNAFQADCKTPSGAKWEQGSEIPFPGKILSSIELADSLLKSNLGVITKHK